jgi:transposase-like protein
MSRKSYSIEDVDKVLGSLAKNNGNIKKTARDTGVSVNTLKKWKNQDPEKYEVIEQQTMDMIKNAQMVVLQNQIQNLVLASQRMAEIIPHEDNIDKLTNAVKMINDQLQRLTGSHGGGKMKGEKKEFVAIFRER